MAKPFDEAIAAARKRRHRNLIAAAFTLFSLALIAGTAFLFISSIRLEVALKEYATEVSATIVKGDAIQLGAERIFPLSDVAEVLVTAEGYQPLTVLINKGEETSPLTIAMEYAPVRVNVLPIEAIENPVWYLDGVIQSSAPQLMLELMPGKHEIKLYSDHHQDIQKFIDVLPAKDQNFDLSVQRKMVAFQITTEPSGADIYFDDRLIGVSPVSGEVPSSQVIIKTSRPDYSAVFEELNLSQTQGAFERRYKLKPRTDNVELAFKPLGGRLYINGIEKPITNQLAIKASEVTLIRYAKKGYKPQEIKVSNANDSVRFELEPAFGGVVINSVPRSKVSVAGRDYGETPAEVTLQATRQNIMLSRAGYAPRELSVEVQEGKKQALDVRLQTWAEYHWSQSQPRLTNSSGINLVRFTPQSFQIGAPRNQKGQRANELLRSVRFTRAIYVSEYEINERQYRLYSGNGPSSAKPVTNISWEDAALFCNWLSQQEGLTPFYLTRGAVIIGFNADSRGYRLPSEAEWEYVARYANKPSPTVFTWGNEYDISKSAGNIADTSASATARTFIDDYTDGVAGTAPVGSYEKELSGLFDMSGNVSEWVHDIYAIELPDKEVVYEDYLGPERGSQHVVKGSNYLSADWTEFRASFKESVDGPRAEVGFRVARYIQ